MAYKLIWSPAARDDLHAIVVFIARDNPNRAMSFGYELVSETDRLQEFPELGPVVPEYRNYNLRENCVPSGSRSKALSDRSRLAFSPRNSGAIDRYGPKYRVTETLVFRYHRRAHDRTQVRFTSTSRSSNSLRYYQARK